MLLKGADPELFKAESYDPEGIAQELWNNGALSHEKAVMELATHYLQLRGRQFMTDYEPVRRAPTKKAPPPRTGDLVREMMNNITSDTMMPPLPGQTRSKPLSAWTWGQLRDFSGALGERLAAFADRPDDELIGDSLQ